MINLKEQVQNNSEIAALLRSNIPLVSRNIQENMWQKVKDWASDRGARLARAGKEVASQGASNVLGTLRRGMEDNAQYQDKVAAKYELLKTSEKLGMDPSKVQGIRQSFERFNGQRPRHPGPGASSADIAKHQADMQDWNAGQKLAANTAAMRSKNPNYDRTLRNFDTNVKRGLKTVNRDSAGNPAPQNVKFWPSGSPMPQFKGLGGLFKNLVKGEENTASTAAGLRRDRWSDVARERSLRRQIANIHGKNPDSPLERFRIGLGRRRI